jgi:4-amino-4-deoxy-L-arabinose transferase-like glycosyltransferase
LTRDGNRQAPAAAQASPGDRTDRVSGSREPSRARRTAAALLAFASSRACLFLALALAIVLRAIPLALSSGHPGRLQSADSADYIYLSDHLDAAYGGDSGTATSDLGLLRTPGYPLVLRGVWELAGHHPHVVGLVQMVFACAAILALHRAAAMLDTPAAGGIAALLIAVDPTAAIFSDLVLSEATFMLLISLAILAFARLAREPSMGRAAVAGGMLGASVLVRPVSLYLILIVAVALVVAAQGVGVARTSTAWLLIVFIAAAAVVPGAWAIRNRSETGVLVVSTVDSYTLLYFAAAPIVASAEGTDYATARAKLEAEVAADLKPGTNAAQRSRAEMRLAIRTIAAHPAATGKELVRSVATTAVGPSRQTMRDVIAGGGAPRWWELPVMAWAFLVVGLVWAGALVGGRVLVRQRRWGVLVGLAIPPCYLIATSLGQGYSRFRVPAMPFLVVLAGIGVAHLLGAVVRGRST